MALFLSHAWADGHPSIPPLFKHGPAGGKETIAGSSVGASHIKVVISALESARLNNEHMYKHVSDAQLSLRTDGRIQKIEKATKHKEPQRADKAHTLKAAGSSAGMSLRILRCPLVLTDPFFFFQDTYTEEELKACSLWCLRSPTARGPQDISVLIRDRASILLSSQTAFRGGSARSLLWSDLFLSKVKLHNVLANDGNIPVGFLFLATTRLIFNHDPCPGFCSPRRQCEAQPDWPG